MPQNILETRRRVLALSAAALGSTSMPSLAEDKAIRVGDLNSYNRWASTAIPYRNGWQLALDDINARGGVLGHRLEVVSRDDGGTPTDAVRAADELVSREGVTVLMGTFLSNISLAVADYAKQKKVVFVPVISGTDALSLEQGNRYTFHVRGNVFMYVNMLVEQAQRLGLQRWAIVAPNYEFGQSAAKAFKRLLKERMPSVQIVAEQYPPLGKLDVGAIANAIEEAKPEGIFNATFGADMALFARDGLSRGLFDNRTVLSIASGYPEYLLPLKGEVPDGWITQGYPWADIPLPEHRAFVAAYQKRYREGPGAFSMMGYVALMMLKTAIEKAGSTSPEALIATMRGMEFPSIVGPLKIRAADNKVTLGSWVGRLAMKDGAGALADWSYKDGANYMIPEAEVRAARRD